MSLLFTLIRRRRREKKASYLEKCSVNQSESLWNWTEATLSGSEKGRARQTHEHRAVWSTGMIPGSRWARLHQSPLSARTAHRRFSVSSFTGPLSTHCPLRNISSVESGSVYSICRHTLCSVYMSLQSIHTYVSASNSEVFSFCCAVADWITETVEDLNVRERACRD